MQEKLNEIKAKIEARLEELHQKSKTWADPHSPSYTNGYDKASREEADFLNGLLAGLRGKMHLYEADTKQWTPFGDKYKPPERFEHCKWHLVATYEQTGEDGQPAKVYEARAPAKFYKVVIFPRGKKPVALSTGSGNGMAELAKNIAKAASEGMLGVAKPEAEEMYNDD